MRYPLEPEREWEEFTETKERRNRKVQPGNRAWCWAGGCVGHGRCLKLVRIAPASRLGVVTVIHLAAGSTSDRSEPSGRLFINICLQRRLLFAPMLVRYLDHILRLKGSFR
jgi:hypothetical protein